MAAISVSDFTQFEINYGDNPFVFDLEEEYIRKGYKKKGFLKKVKDFMNP